MPVFLGGNLALFSQSQTQGNEMSYKHLLLQNSSCHHNILGHIVHTHCLTDWRLLSNPYNS